MGARPLALLGFFADVANSDISQLPRKALYVNILVSFRCIPVNIPMRVFERGDLR